MAIEMQEGEKQVVGNSAPSPLNSSVLLIEPSHHAENFLETLKSRKSYAAADLPRWHLSMEIPAQKPVEALRIVLAVISRTPPLRLDEPTLCKC